MTVSLENNLKNILLFIWRTTVNCHYFQGKMNDIWKFIPLKSSVLIKSLQYWQNEFKRGRGLYLQSWAAIPIFSIHIAVFTERPSKVNIGFFKDPV